MKKLLCVVNYRKAKNCLVEVTKSCFYIFSYSIQKLQKNKFRGAFSFAMQESQLLEKTAFWVKPFIYLLAFIRQKTA